MPYPPLACKVISQGLTLFAPTVQPCQPPIFNDPWRIAEERQVILDELRKAFHGFPELAASEQFADLVMQAVQLSVSSGLGHGRRLSGSRMRCR